MVLVQSFLDQVVGNAKSQDALFSFRKVQGFTNQGERAVRDRLRLVFH